MSIEPVGDTRLSIPIPRDMYENLAEIFRALPYGARTQFFRRICEDIIEIYCEDKTLGRKFIVAVGMRELSLLDFYSKIAREEQE